MSVLVISKKEVIELLDMRELICELKKAYISYSSNKTIQMKRAVAEVGNNSIVVNFPGCIANDKYYTVKVNVKNPDNPKNYLPFLQGTILMIDCLTGKLIALFESSLITAMRTGAAGAIGVEALAISNINSVALLGAGVQGEWQLRALHAIGRLDHANIFDTNTKAAESLARLLSSDLGITTTVSDSIENAVADAKILITTTPSREAIIKKSMLKNGLHINAFGADQPGKVEIAEDVIENSIIIADDKNLALSDGALNTLHACNTINKSQLNEIGDVLSGVCSGRTRENQITIFANVGLAFQDLVACKIVYEKALILNYGVKVNIG